jgi:hypothetical protein
MPDDERLANDEALALLRPGMSMTDVAEAMGTSWRTPAPHKGGVIATLENSHGVVVHLDREDVVGCVSFDWRFTNAPIDGVRIGMALAEARNARPDLQVGDDLPMMRGVREGVAEMLNGALMRVRFTLEKVNGISLPRTMRNTVSHTHRPIRRRRASPELLLSTSISSWPSCLLSWNRKCSIWKPRSILQRISLAASWILRTKIMTCCRRRWAIWRAIH